STRAASWRRRFGGPIASLTPSGCWQRSRCAPVPAGSRPADYLDARIFRILPAMILEHELETALELVTRCGAIALEIQSGGVSTLQTSDKPDNQGPVTRADIAVETMIVEAPRASFPDDAILAEELARDPSWQR